MPTINVANSGPSTDGFLTRIVTNDAEVEYDTYAYNAEQDYLSIKNNGLNDIMFSVAEFENVVLHGLQTWTNEVNFNSFDIIALKESTSFTATTKEYDNTPVRIDSLWELMAIRDKTETGDMILNTTNATTSAGTINTAIAGVNKKYSRDVEFTLKNTAGTTHEWFNGVFPVAVTKVSTAGIVKIKDSLAYATFINGVGTVSIEMTGTWVQNDTVTVTITGGSKYGYPITNKDNVDTLGA